MTFSYLTASIFLSIGVAREIIMEQTFRINSDYADSDWILSGSSVRQRSACPSGNACLELDPDEQAWIYVSTIGYHSIELTYSMSSFGIFIGYCRMWYIIGQESNSIDDWTLLSEDRSNDKTTTFTQSIPNAENNDIVGIYLVAHKIGSGDACYYNDFKLTGIPITQSPTPKPTPKPSEEPTANPISKQTDSPTNLPSDEPTGQPSHHPSLNPTGNPFPPTNDPTATPSFQPTKQPTESARDGTANSTENPTYFPSGDSSMSPTIKPTKGSQTKGPTKDPTMQPTPGTSLIDNADGLKKSDDSLQTIIAIASSIIFSLICIIFGMCLFIKKLKREMGQTLQHPKTSNIASISLASMNENNDRDGIEDTNNVNQSDEESDSDSDSNGMYKAQTVITKGQNEVTRGNYVVEIECTKEGNVINLEEGNVTAETPGY